MAIKSLLSKLGLSKQSDDKKFIAWIKRTTGYQPENISLYHLAFSHRSTSGAKKEGKQSSNERLEFLGDAVLGSIIAEHLFRIYPTKDEGFLTQVRSRIVNGQNLKALAVKFGFDEYLKTSLRQQEKTGSSAYGDAFEAFIGAMYLDKGYDKTRKFVLNKVVKHHVDIEGMVSTNTDYKSQLQIFCQRNKHVLEYRLLSEKRSGHNKIYEVQVYINDEPKEKFENFSKKVAEQRAAQLTLEAMNLSNG